MSAIADDAMAKEEFTMLDVVNEVSDKVNYKQEEEQILCHLYLRYVG